MPRVQKSLTVRQAARRLKISVPATLKALKSGRLKGERVTITRQVWQIAADAVRRYEVSKPHQAAGKKQ